MNKLIRKNQKKLLAIFSVLLMFVFIVSLSARGPGGGGRREAVVVGHMGKTALTDQDLSAAKDEWAVLMRTGVQTRMSMQPMPLPYAVLSPMVVQDVREHPELYLLLKREAEENGVRVSDDEAKAVWVNSLRRTASTLNPIEVEAMRGILTIKAESDQLAEAVKVSTPAWQRSVATELQGVRLNLVEFRAEDFDKSVQAPTQQQLQEQFEKYKNVAPRSVGSALSPGESSTGLGFGYQVPSRVKLQYITIPKAQIVASLQPTPEKRHEWEVKAADYYLSHQSDYIATPSTQPATKPAELFGPAASQPATAPATTAPTTVAAAPQPTTKPFEEVSASIVEKLMEADVKKQSDVVEKDIAGQLAADWIAIRRADPSATQPASTQPASTQSAASQPGAPTTQPTLARLEAIRADVLARLHVSIEIHEINAWQNSQQLGALPGIGTAQTADRDSFNTYALTFTGQFTNATAAPLQVWEPSQALTDPSDNTYVFRLTAAQTAHAPEEMTPFVPQLAADWRVAQTYELAKQAAQKLLGSAKSLGLSQATRTGGQTIISTGQFSPRVGSRPIPNYPLMDSTAQADLGAAAQKLLAESNSADQHPDGLAELPSIRRALVIELAGAQLPFEIPLWQAQAETVQQQRLLAVQSLTTDWFAYNAVVARTQYKSEEKSNPS